MSKMRIGKSARGTVVHIIIEKSNRALCEKKQIGLVVDPELTAKDITCKRCMATAIFKKELATIEAKELIKKKAKEEEAAKAKEEEEAAKAKEEEAAKAKEEEKINTSNFYEKKLKNGSFKLIHKATGKAFFSNIEKEIVTKALSNLNDIGIEWKSRHDKIPTGYISLCRIAVALAYKESKITLPKAFKDAEEDKERKAHRTIKRRKNKKVVSETDKKTNQSISKTQKIFDLITSQMHMPDGISLANLMNKTAKTFELSSKKSSSKIKKVIRQLREKDITITIKTKRDKKNDIYTIKTD